MTLAIDSMHITLYRSPSITKSTIVEFKRPIQAREINILISTLITNTYTNKVVCSCSYHRVDRILFPTKTRTMTTTTYTFPHTVLTPLVGKPTLATLTLLKLELYANARYVH
jgi:hypothetical protein